MQKLAIHQKFGNFTVPTVIYKTLCACLQILEPVIPNNINLISGSNKIPQGLIMITFEKRKCNFLFELKCLPLTKSIGKNNTTFNLFVEVYSFEILFHQTEIVWSILECRLMDK